MRQPPVARQDTAPPPTGFRRERSNTDFPFLRVGFGATVVVVACTTVVVAAVVDGAAVVAGAAVAGGLVVVVDVVGAAAATVPTFTTGAEYVIFGNTTFTPVDPMTNDGVTASDRPAFSILPAKRDLSAASVLSTFQSDRTPFGKNAVKFPSCTVEPFVRKCGAAVFTSSDFVFVAASTAIVGKWKYVAFVDTQIGEGDSAA